MAPCGKRTPRPMHMSDRGTLEQRGGQPARVPLCHTPTVCPATGTSQAHREDLPAGLNPCAQFLHITDILSLCPCPWLQLFTFVRKKPLNPLLFPPLLYFSKSQRLLPSPEARTSPEHLPYPFGGSLQVLFLDPFEY